MNASPMDPSDFKAPEEWLRQAEYDFETAKAMLTSGRYIYTVFMCHLSIEKALKGLYVKQCKKDPPETHNLNFLCEEANIELTEQLQNSLDKLNSLSVPTRYPDDLERLLKDYKEEVTEKVLNQTRELLICLKQML